MSLVAGCPGPSSSLARMRTAVRRCIIAASMALALTAAASTLEAQQAAPLNSPPASERAIRAFQQKVDAIADLQLEDEPASDEAVRAFHRKLELIADPQVNVVAKRLFEAQKRRAVNIERIRALNIARRGRWGGNQPIEGRQTAGSLLMQLEVEMAFVRKVCAPPLDQVGEIRNDLQRCLAESLQGPAVPCEVLRDRLTDAVARHLSRSEAARYRAEVTKRRTHERAACVNTFVVLLDQQLSFSEKQRQALVAALLAKWKPEWSQTIEVAVASGDRTVPAIPDELIGPLLDAEQLKTWHALPKEGDLRPAFNALRIGSTGVAIAVPED
jgi:hypothetical protein